MPKSGWTKPELIQAVDALRAEKENNERVLHQFFIDLKSQLLRIIDDIEVTEYEEITIQKTLNPEQLKKITELVSAADDLIKNKSDYNITLTETNASYIIRFLNKK